MLQGGMAMPGPGTVEHEASMRRGNCDLHWFAAQGPGGCFPPASVESLAAEQATMAAEV